MTSNLPSGYKTPKPGKKPSYMEHVKMPSVSHDNVNFIAIIALILSVISLFISISSGGLSDEDRSDLQAIAQDLRDIQQKEIILTSPLRTTVVIEESFPISDILPADFKLYIDERIPLDTQVTARSNTGQIVTFNIVDDMRLQAEIPIDAQRSLAGAMVNINKEIPLDTRFTATLRVNAVYGKELNDIVNRIDKISQK